MRVYAPYSTNRVTVANVSLCARARACVVCMLLQPCPIKRAVLLVFASGVAPGGPGPAVSGPSPGGEPMDAPPRRTGMPAVGEPKIGP